VTRANMTETMKIDRRPLPRHSQSQRLGRFRAGALCRGLFQRENGIVKVTRTQGDTHADHDPQGELHVSHDDEPTR
jgi:hypothetical protein